MQKTFLTILLILSTYIFPFYTGINYTFRNSQYKNFIILTSSVERRIAVFNINTNKVEFFFQNVGVYPAVSYMYKNKILTVDTVGKKLILIDLKENKKYYKKLEYKPLFYQNINNIVYILDSNGNLFGYDFQLNIKFHHKFLSNPDYFYFYNNSPIGLYIWDKNIDFEYQNKQYNYNMITPSLVVSNFIIDTRGGKIFDLEENKSYKSEPYISFAAILNNNLYFGSMYSNTIYMIKNGKIEMVKKLNYQPTFGKSFDNKLYILSSTSNKLIVFNPKNDKIIEYNTGEYPIQLFKHNNKIIVISSEYGEINIIEN